MLAKSICHFRAVDSILPLILLFFFDEKSQLANNDDPDQTPHYVASDLDVHCLPIILLWVSRYE